MTRQKPPSAAARLLHKAFTRHALRRWLVAGVAATTTLAVIAVGAPFAAANTGDRSHSSARFLSGSVPLAGTSLDSVVALGGVEATNAGVPTADVQHSPLDISALGAQLINLPSGISVALSQFLQLGLVNQYAEADDNGVSRSASGAVSDTGAVDTAGSGAFPASASIDLVGILTPALTAGVLSTARLAANAITAVAALDGSTPGAPTTTCANLSDPTQCRDYNIASATVDLASPLVAALVGSINTSLGTLDTTVNGLETSLVTGVLDGVTNVLALLNGLLPGLSLVSNTLAVNVTVDLQTALASVLSQTLTDGVVSINLATGAIHVDLDQLTGGLNGLAPNTSVLTSAVITDLVNRIGALLANLVTQVNTTLDAALDAVTVTIGGNICLLEVVTCLAGLDVSYSGTLGELAAGAAPLTVSGTGLLGVIVVGPTLTSVLGALQLSLDTVVSPVLAAGLTTVTNVATAAVSTLVTALNPVLEALPTVLGLTANVQEFGASAGVYREVALRATLFAGGGATLDLARAEVGANGLVPRIDAMLADHGPLVGGNTVTVTGSQFIAGTTVTFDGGTITPDAINPAGTVLTFTVPVGTVSGPVVVTVDNAIGASAPAIYTYDPPELTATGPVRPGDSAPIASSGWPPNTVVTVQLSKSAIPVGSPITVTTNASGAFPVGTVIDVPASADLGTYAVTGTDVAGDHASDSLVVASVAGVFASSLHPTSGPVAGGQTVTIRGSGFESDSLVTIGGNSATPTEIDPDGLWLKFVTPPHAAGPVGVTVTSHGLTSDPLTYTYIPAPVALSLDPDRGPVSGGQLVTITGSNFTADSEVTIGGKTVTPEFVAGSGTSLTFVTPPHPAGPVDVTVTTPGGTSAPLTYTYVPDDQLPPPPVITDPPDGGTVTDQTPPISGTGEPGGAVDVIETGVVICSATVDADGNWTCTPETDMPYGSHTITAQQTVNGLTSGQSDAVTFTIIAGGPGLSMTGVDVGDAAVAALVLLALGGSFVALGRIRRHRALRLA